MAADIVPQGNSIAVNGNYLGGLGLTGEQWVNETANRSVDVEYTNNEGKPIMVNIYVTASTSSTSHIKIDGEPTIYFSCTASGGQDVSTPSFIVPDGSTYEIVGNTYFNVKEWVELK